MAEVLTATPDIDESLLALVKTIDIGGATPDYNIDEIPVDAQDRAILIQYQDDVPEIDDNVSPISRQRYLIAAREQHPKTAKTTMREIRDYLHRKEAFDIGGIRCTFCYADSGITRFQDEDSRLYIAICYFMFILKEGV